MTSDHGEDPQLKLLLLSQRLTSLKRQREYNLKDFAVEDEAVNDMDANIDKGFSEEGKEQSDVDEFLSKRFVDETDDETYSEKENEDELDEKYVESDDDLIAPWSLIHDLESYEGESENNDVEEDSNGLSHVAFSKHLMIDKPEAECGKTGVGFSRLADYYRYPEFLHKIDRTKNIDRDNENDGDCTKGSENDDEEATGMKRHDPSDESSQLPSRKSASNRKSARKSGLKKKIRQTLSGRLLDISDDVAVSSDAMIRMDTLFHQCVCAFPWRCEHSMLAQKTDVYLNEDKMKKISRCGHGGSMVHGGSEIESRLSGRGDYLTGWGLSKNGAGQYGYGGGGRKVSSAKESNRKRKYDPFIHRNISDSSKYTFKHYQDWQAYVDEYRRYYSVGQTGRAMKSHQIPEGGGRREAVVIVRTLSESLIRPRIQECNIPNWDDFTDLSTTPMRPLHIGPGYRSGKVPDLGVTWLAAATAHHHEVPADYRHPASRHIKLSNIRQADAMTTHIKKRHQQTLLESSSSTPRVGTILPHDAGMTIPMEPLHIVEDFRKGPRKERLTADMQPIGCRFLASWRPNESTRVRSAKTRSRKNKSSDGIQTDEGSSPHGQMYSKQSGKQSSLQPLSKGQSQTRAGFLKLFTPPKGLDVFHVPSGSDDTGQVNDTTRISTSEIKVKGKSSPASTKWTNMSNSAGDKRSRSDSHDNSASGKRSATKSGTLARRPTARLNNEPQTPQKELLHVRGESKKNKQQDVQSRDDKITETQSSSKEDIGVFAKTRIKLVAPFAQPLTQDNVLIGSPYMTTSPHFGSEELSVTVQSTG
ncbi:uncharacterized protein LOC129254704 [Lytechinus pictus]|uniref:uncharacterized protein LOC129254704 n=1 Tax=Lytechinus pictus TaxID=7653 RepID=UPI0030B9EF37